MIINKQKKRQQIFGWEINLWIPTNSTVKTLHVQITINLSLDWVDYKPAEDMNKPHASKGFPKK